MDGFRNEDEAIGHWLARLRDGGAEEQATARTELALILERRGMIDDAIEGYRTNVQAGARDRRAYDRLAAIYRARGDAVAESAVLEALGRMLRGTESPTMTDLPPIARAPNPSDAAPAPRPAVVPAAHQDAPSVDVDPEAYAPPEAQTAPHRAVPAPPASEPGPAYAATARRGQRPVGRPIASPGARQGSISPATGVLIALLGLLVLIAAIAFALLWSGGRLGGLTLWDSGSGGATATSAPAGSTTTGATSSGGPTTQAAAGPAATPTRAPPAAECWDPSVRFPESRQPEDSVRRALLEHLERQDGAVDPGNPQVASLVDAHVGLADELLAGWMGVQLQRSQRRLPLFSLSSYIGSELLVPNEVGQYTLRPTISEQGWREIQAWTAESCEGAFVTRPENASWVTLMRASVGDISWAQAAPSPFPSPSPARR